MGREVETTGTGNIAILITVQCSEWVVYLGCDVEIENMGVYGISLASIF